MTVAKKRKPPTGLLAAGRFGSDQQLLRPSKINRETCRITKIVLIARMWVRRAGWQGHIGNLEPREVVVNLRGTQHNHLAQFDIEPSSDSHCEGIAGGLVALGRSGSWR